MNVPIPPLYLAEEEDGNWLVIDGLQRLSSIKSYFENENALKSLEIIKELEGLKYKDLPVKMRNLLNDGLLRTNVIKKESHSDIKYDIFTRLNSGAVILNDQEVRNCLYRGSLNNLAKELCKNKDFQKILGQKGCHPRFLDTEFILRYFAFSENMKIENGSYYIERYLGSLKQFINDFMRNNANLPNVKLQNLRDRFNSVIDKVLVIFPPEQAFRDPNSTSRKVNKAVADSVMLGLENIEKKHIEAKKSELYNIILRILKSDEFSTLLRKRTADKNNVNSRIRMMVNGIKNDLSL
jgi:hypothetical protein